MKKLIYWLLVLVPAIILLQTLFFKFSGAPESVYIFSTLGVEPYGRIGLGFIELIAAVLLIIPKTSLYGAILGVGLMVGAIGSHVFVLGIEVQNDGGTLFLLAIITLICCSSFLFFRKKLI